MIGSVAVGLVFVESDGTIDPSTENWTAEEMVSVEVDLQAALDWWTAREPRADLDWVLVNEGLAYTGYEPINRSSTMDGLWIGEAMQSLGYPKVRWVFDAVYAYLSDIRNAYATDWAFVVFVVDSSSDADGLFADNGFAGAYLGGPLLFTTSDADGYAGYLAPVFAHEIGHVFWALDQYYSARVACDKVSGVLGAPNQNSQYSECLSDVPSVMRGGVAPYRAGALDYYACGQVGWWDRDLDGILDSIDPEVGEPKRIYLPLLRMGVEQ